MAATFYRIGSQHTCAITMDVRGQDEQKRPEVHRGIACVAIESQNKAVRFEEYRQGDSYIRQDNLGIGTLGSIKQEIMREGMGSFSKKIKQRKKLRRREISARPCQLYRSIPNPLLALSNETRTNP
jgi:hypothetical protein